MRHQIHLKKGDTIWISLEGLTDKFTLPEHNADLVHVFNPSEKDTANPAVYVWSDKERQDFTHKISLEGAKK